MRKLRHNKEELRELRKVRKAKAKALREALKETGLYHVEPGKKQYNRTSSYQSVEEEQTDRVMTAAVTLEHINRYLPVLLRRLKRIPDPRNVKMVKHKITLLLTYGILLFVYQMSSRREANREMTRPQFHENLRLFLPAVTSTPHQDTLWRLLERIDVEEISEAHQDLLAHLMTKKKFQNWLVQKAYVLAVDGTQKLKSRCLWDDGWQTRTHEGKVTGHFIYVVEASLVFRNGLVLPVMSEFLTPDEIAIMEGKDAEEVKRDCEQMAGRRLLSRIKKRYPRLRILVCLDGLYANGPMMAFLRSHHWDYMIVLQDDCLTDVWEDFHGLQKIEKGHVLKRTWQNRRQVYHWSNEIEYEYRSKQGRRAEQKVHLVVLEETWEEIDQQGSIVTKSSRFAWISERPLSRNNVFERCMYGGRVRWGIEEENLIAKHRGYHYKHAFAYTGQSMKGYHYLLRLGLLLNSLLIHSADLIEEVEKKGMQGLIAFIVGTLSGPWFSGYETCIKEMMAKPKRLVLV